MKRVGNLWQSVISEENIRLAIKKASKNKYKSASYVREHEEECIKNIREMLINKTYKTSNYNIFSLFEPKLRLIYALPFYPDRIVHHAIMNVIEPIWDSMLISDTYACRKGKGQHKGVQKCIYFQRKYKYCLKGDISQFYITISHEKLKEILRKKIKDKDLLWLLDEIVDSICTCSENLKILNKMKETHPNCTDVPRGIKKLEKAINLFGSNSGVPIGNYLSQWFGNIYMNDFDQYVKVELKQKAYVRYCDDFIIFGNDKEELYEIKNLVEQYLFDNLNLCLSKKQVFPTSKGIDFLGYRCFNNYILLRKNTAKRFKKTLSKIKLDKNNIKEIEGKLASYCGWLSWANTYNLYNRLNIKKYKIFVMKYKEDNMRGYPKYLNTKADYLYVKDNFPKEFWENDFRNLLDTQYDWFSVGVAEGEGIEDLTHKVIVDEEGNKTQYEYKYNKSNRLTSLGFTEQEVTEILEE